MLVQISPLELSIWDYSWFSETQSLEFPLVKNVVLTKSHRERATSCTDTQTELRKACASSSLVCSVLELKTRKPLPALPVLVRVSVRRLQVFGRPGSCGREGRISCETTGLSRPWTLSPVPSSVKKVKALSFTVWVKEISRNQLDTGFSAFWALSILSS